MIMCECDCDMNRDQLDEKCTLSWIKCQMPADNEYDDTKLDPLRSISAGIYSRLV